MPATNTITIRKRLDLDIFEKLIQQYQPKGSHVFDIEIVSIMPDNGINYTATFNKKDFVYLTEVRIIELS